VSTAKDFDLKETHDLELFQLLQSFFVNHCAKEYQDNFIVNLDPEVVDFHDVVRIVCNLLGYTFM
jgi:hypothetical protein